MATVTFRIPDDVLRRARNRALEQNTSVNALVRHYLGHLEGADPAREAGAESVENPFDEVQAVEGQTSA